MSEEFIKQRGINSLPIPILDILRAEKIEVVYSRSKGVESGFALREHDRRIIGVNSLEPAKRQRFTMAHELGHLILHADRELTVDQSFRVYRRDGVSSMATDLQEIEANAFAAALLMPANSVQDELGLLLKGFSGTRDQLTVVMAKKYDVSSQAMGFRLVNLGMLSP